MTSRTSTPMPFNAKPVGREQLAMILRSMLTQQIGDQITVGRRTLQAVL